jgi:putative spermidine/putrescine transport system permease protein
MGRVIAITESGLPQTTSFGDRLHAVLHRTKLWWLVLPALMFFVAFCIVPVASLFALSLDKPVAGVVTLQGNFTFANFTRFFATAAYYGAALRSVGIAVVVALIAAVLGYPLAYVIAKTEHPGRNTLLMILVLASMQLDLVIRMYGLMVLLGDNGLVNQILLKAGLVSAPVHLMYNVLGVVIGLVQVTLPFMVLSLIGIIRGIHPSLEEAARSLGASRWAAFWRVTLPLSMPGLLAGTLLVFALSISSYAVPALMGGWKVVVLPIHIYQQVAEVGRWQFGATNAAALFVVSIFAVAVYVLMARRASGGRT